MKRLTGHFVAFCGALFLFPGLAFRTSYGATGGNGLVHIVIRVVLRLLSPFMIRAGGALYVEGRKLSTLTIEELLEKDKRPPVLYLRSFELEKFTNHDAGKFSKVLAASFSDINIQTQEEVLVRALKRVGPCIAVGDPQNNEIIFGCSRMRLGAEWQQSVQEWIKKSALVVHCAGGTDGLLWELGQVAELVQPRSKLVLLVTPTITQEWWQRADQLFGRVPRFTVSGEEKLPYIAVIYFDEKGKLHNELVYGVGKSPRIILEEALDPLLHQLKIRPRPKIIRWLTDTSHLIQTLMLSVVALATLLLLLLITVGEIRSFLLRK
jgi:hypothetical protein